eukprot:scaffold45594_cov19-Tisochrysis_lutea.AAC.1
MGQWLWRGCPSPSELINSERGNGCGVTKRNQSIWFQVAEAVGSRHLQMQMPLRVWCEDSLQFLSLLHLLDRYLESICKNGRGCRIAEVHGSGAHALLEEDTLGY